MVVLPVLLLLGSLFPCSRAQTQYNVDALREAALNWSEPLTCNTWDCNCTFNRQPGCCCAANEMYKVEDETSQRLVDLLESVTALYHRVTALTDSVKIAFKATMNKDGKACFGPVNANVVLPFNNVTLNYGNGYNPSLGIFTAPCSGVYVFSFTVYSSVVSDEGLYHKVMLVKNGVLIVSVWESNREDNEDSATQVIVLELERGDQVYLEMMSGRRLCKNREYSIFTGHILYPYTDEMYY